MKLKVNNHRKRTLFVFLKNELDYLSSQSSIFIICCCKNFLKCSAAHLFKKALKLQLLICFACSSSLSFKYFRQHLSLNKFCTENLSHLFPSAVFVWKGGKKYQIFCKDVHLLVHYTLFCLLCVISGWLPEGARFSLCKVSLVWFFCCIYDLF